MSQLFGRDANHYAKTSLLLVALALGGAYFLADSLQRSPYVTEVELIRDQPVPFTHQHHVTGLGIDCRYCHTSVEKSGFAGIPPTSTCMNCHSQIWSDAPMLEPVRESYRSGKPIPWVRVNDLPDFVYFNHSVHVAKGVGCSSCHGAVHEQPITWKAKTLYMAFCLECHKHPENYLREKGELLKTDWRPRSDQVHFGMDLVQKNQVIRGNITCSACHR